MVVLLTQTWKCGMHLSGALLSLYGGHVMRASVALRKLAAAADRPALKGSAALSAIARAPERSLEDHSFAAAGVPNVQWPAMRATVRAALQTLVTQGFMPLESETDKRR